MLLDLTASQSIVVYATPAKAWNVLTNPEIIKEYLYGTETVTDWKPGSEIIFQGEYQGQKYHDKGVIQENILHEKISYTYWSAFTGTEDKPENYSLVILTLKKIDDNHTEFTWTNKGFATEAGYKHSVDGMTAFLEQIKAIMER